jgi:hypothetical protein
LIGPAGADGIVLAAGRLFEQVPLVGESFQSTCDEHLKQRKEITKQATTETNK